MIATKIPAVLLQRDDNSLSVERVLKLAIELLDEVVCKDDSMEDLCRQCQEELGELIQGIDHG